VLSPRDDSRWVPDGEYRVKDDNGRLRVIISFSAGVVHGLYKDFWSNGHIASEGEFVNGYRQGFWRHYNKDGTFRETIHFVDSKEVVDWKRFFTGEEPAAYKGPEG
jgi:antitoxin component YwqK of YwqJK toxin-antitoxin module